jgi:hypothetical protein
MEKDLGRLLFTTPSSIEHYKVDWHELGFTIYDDDDFPGRVELRVHLYKDDSQYKSLNHAIDNLLKQYAEQYLSTLIEESFLDE